MVRFARVTLALIVLVIAALFGATAEAIDLRGVGVVLMHGKGSSSGIEPVAAALSARGAIVVTPQMSWLQGYRTYDQTLAEVDAAVASLKAQGASRIILGGHSLGANLALAYAARRPGVFAVVAMGPGHQPDRYPEHHSESLRAARAMIAAGRGNELSRFIDNNQGRIFDIETTAAAYVSFFDPKGAASMSRNAARLRGTPVLWLIGTYDRGAQGYGTNAGRSRRIVVEADHRTTPAAGAREVVAWLEAL